MPSTFTRNDWTVGIPYFLIGIELAEKKHIIRNSDNHKTGVFSLITLALCLFEHYILVQRGINGSRDSYLFLIPFSVPLFVSLYNLKCFQKNGKIAQWGMKYSLILYIVHPLFVRVEYAIWDITTCWQYFGFAIVLATAFASTVLYKELKDVAV